MSDQLFAYGTLVPGGTYWDVIAASVVATRHARVPGRLFDTGRGYPAATFREHGGTTTTTGGPTAAGAPVVVEGVVLSLAPEEHLWARLDAFEGDEYERLQVRTEAGDAVFTYHWRAPLDGFVPIAGGRWHELRSKNLD